MSNGGEQDTKQNKALALTLLEESVYQLDLDTQRQVDKEIEKSKKEIRAKIAIFQSEYGEQKSAGKYKNVVRDITTIIALLTQNIELILTSHFENVGKLVGDKLKTLYGLNMEVKWQVWKYPNGDTYIKSLERVRKVVTDNVVVDIKQYDRLGWETKALTKQVENRIKTLRNTVNAINHTDASHIQSQIVIEMLKKAGYKKFKYVAILDSRTSKMCQEMNGQVFPLSQAEIGVNVPPLHTHCRSHIEPME